jgi:hypothetical protein
MKDCYFILFYLFYNTTVCKNLLFKPCNILTAARLLAGIAGSNPTGGMDVCCECCVFVR